MSSNPSSSEVVLMRHYIKKECEVYKYFDLLEEKEFTCLRCNRKAINLLKKYNDQLFLTLTPYEIRKSMGIPFKDAMPVRQNIYVLKRKGKFVGQVEDLLTIQLDEISRKVTKVYLYSHVRYRT